MTSMTTIQTFIFCSLALVYLGDLRLVFGACETPCDSTEPRHSTVETCLVTNTTDPASSVINSLYAQIQKEECRLDDSSEFPPQYCPFSGERFDFIVVGSGPGGCVMANRLTEDPNITVLLLEAGKNPPKSSKVPNYCYSLVLSDIDWKYKTEPEPTNGLGLKGNRQNVPAGMVLGGSTAYNQLSWIRGIPGVFDSWAKDGNTGWDYASIDKYFRRVEDLNKKDIKALKDWQKYHSEGGPVSVDSLESKGVKPIIKALQNGCLELGDKLNPDFDGESNLGLGSYLGTIKNGRRCSAASAYLSPITNRTNLKVTREAFVTKVLIDENKKAYGVEYTDINGKQVNVLANKEVIISAGPFNSPKLLMLSGIGPKDHLEEMGIEVVQDSPVGKTLKDQPIQINLVLKLDYTRNVMSDEEKMYQFLTRKGTGLSGIGLLNWLYMFNTNKSSELPQLQINFSEADKGDGNYVKLIERINGIKEETMPQYYNLVDESFLLFAYLSLVNPKGSGHLELRSKDPNDPPKIFCGYLSNSEDLEVMLGGIKKIEQLTATKGLQGLNARLVEITPEECKKYPVGSDDSRICSMKYLVGPSFNYVGTCKMGADSNPTAVVDPQLRVNGIDCLRVIDSSVMRSVPSVGIQAATYMLAEKGADMVKESWKTTNDGV